MFEKVNPNHPDKVADRIAGAIVDLAYSKNENPKVAVEVLIGHGICNIIIESNVSFKKEIDFYYELNDNKLIYVTPINKINVTSLKVSNIIFSNDNECYFISDDTLYYVNKDKIIKLMTYSEWKFNNDYIYIFK